MRAANNWNNAHLMQAPENVTRTKDNDDNKVQMIAFFQNDCYVLSIW